MLRTGCIPEGLVSELCTPGKMGGGTGTSSEQPVRALSSEQRICGLGRRRSLKELP